MYVFPSYPCLEECSFFKCGGKCIQRHHPDSLLIDLHDKHSCSVHARQGGSSRRAPTSMSEEKTGATSRIDTDGQSGRSTERCITTGGLDPEGVERSDSPVLEDGAPCTQSSRPWRSRSPKRRCGRGKAVAVGESEALPPPPPPLKRRWREARESCERWSSESDSPMHTSTPSARASTDPREITGHDDCSDARSRDTSLPGELRRKLGPDIMALRRPNVWLTETMTRAEDPMIRNMVIADRQALLYMMKDLAPHMMPERYDRPIPPTREEAVAEGCLPRDDYTTAQWLDYSNEYIDPVAQCKKLLHYAMKYRMMVGPYDRYEDKLYALRQVVPDLQRWERVHERARCMRILQAQTDTRCALDAAPLLKRTRSNSV